MVRMTGCTVIVTARMADRPPMLTHSFDTPGGVDFRLVRVPRNEHPPSPRPVFGWEEERIPRFAGAARGPIPAYESEGAAATQPIGTVPQPAGPTHAYWEAMSGIANEKGLMIGESTCSSIFGAELRSSGGKGAALMTYMELSRIALERCERAREAVELMGRLAEEHGFAGNGPELSGSAESLALIDAEEAWVMHLMPDQTGASAIWAAQRVPEVAPTRSPTPQPQPPNPNPRTRSRTPQPQPPKPNPNPNPHPHPNPNPNPEPEPEPDPNPRARRRACPTSS